MKDKYILCPKCGKTLSGTRESCIYCGAIIKKAEIVDGRIPKRECPYCAEEIHDEAIKCKHCGEWLEKDAQVPPHEPSTAVRCPRCGSDSITANKKGFGLGKAAVGGLLIGPVGLLGGLFGSKKIKVFCLKCGHSWKPGGRL